MYQGSTFPLASFDDVCVVLERLGVRLECSVQAQPGLRFEVGRIPTGRLVETKVGEVISSIVDFDFGRPLRARGRKVVEDEKLGLSLQDLEGEVRRLKLKCQSRPLSIYESRGRGLAFTHHHIFYVNRRSKAEGGLRVIDLIL